MLDIVGNNFLYKLVTIEGYFREGTTCEDSNYKLLFDTISNVVDKGTKENESIRKVCQSRGFPEESQQKLKGCQTLDNSSSSIDEWRGVDIMQ